MTDIMVLFIDHLIWTTRKATLLLMELIQVRKPLEAPKTFRRGLVNMDVPMAQLGFVVLTCRWFRFCFPIKRIPRFFL